MGTSVPDATLTDTVDWELEAVIGNTEEKNGTRPQQHANWSDKGDFRDLYTHVRHPPPYMPFAGEASIQDDIVPPPPENGDVKPEAPPVGPSDGLLHSFAIHHLVLVQKAGLVLSQVLHVPCVRLLRTLSERTRQQIHDRDHQNVRDPCDPSNGPHFQSLDHRSVLLVCLGAR